MSGSDHEKRIRRLELQLWGPDDEPEKGIMARVMMTESIALELKSYAQKMMWLLIATVALALFNLVINKPATHAGSTQSTSVITSDAVKGMGAPTESNRDYLLVSEVATKEGVTERTILNWIKDKLIQPEPTQTSKGWQINKDYMIPAKLAQTSENFRNIPKISAIDGSDKQP